MVARGFLFKEGGIIYAKTKSKYEQLAIICT